MTLLIVVTAESKHLFVAFKMAFDAYCDLSVYEPDTAVSSCNFFKCRVHNFEPVINNFHVSALRSYKLCHLKGTQAWKNNVSLSNKLKL